MLEMTEYKAPIKLGLAFQKRHRLKKREANFIREYIKPKMTLAQAVVNAGYNPKNGNNASRMGVEIIHRPHVMSALDEIIHGNALDDEISATYKEILNRRFDNADPALQLKVDEVKLKAIQQLNRLKGKEQPKKTEHTRKSVSFQGFLPKGTATNPSGSVNVTAERLPNPSEPKVIDAQVLPSDDSSIEDPKEPKA